MSGFRIDVADLLAHPGARRPLRLTEELEGLRGPSARVERPVTLDLTLERIPDGIVVRGSVRAEWDGQCSLCLRDLHERTDLHVDELFEPEPVEGETYPLEGHVIDLAQLVRDAVLLELPLAPHCAEPCEPGSLADSDEEPDPRWSALSELDL